MAAIWKMERDDVVDVDAVEAGDTWFGKDTEDDVVDWIKGSDSVGTVNVDDVADGTAAAAADDDDDDDNGNDDNVMI